MSTVSRDLNVCPDREGWLRFAEGQLDPSTVQALCAHLIACPRCQTALVKLAGNADAVDEPDKPSPSSTEAFADTPLSLQHQHPTAAPGMSCDGHETSSASASPPQFGSYRIERELGRGGMGIVYLAHDLRLERQVALKIPAFSAKEGDEVAKRFEREARAAAMLRHPNICQVYDVGEVDGVFYMTIAYVEGQMLSDLVRPDQPLPQRQAATLVRTVALALQYAHEQGIVHRDLKPSNIMLNHRGEPVVMDFGLARRLNPEVSQLTLSGAIMGTLGYMAPEQLAADQDQIGPASDIYSLGVVLYELLVGRLPFRGSMATQIVKILTADPEPPAVRRAGLSAELSEICMKALAKDPANRYESMSQFAQRLDEYLSHATADEPPLNQPDELASPAANAAVSPAEPPSQSTGWSTRTLAFARKPLVVAAATGLCLIMLAMVMGNWFDRSADEPVVFVPRDPPGGSTPSASLPEAKPDPFGNGADPPKTEVAPPGTEVAPPREDTNASENSPESQPIEPPSEPIAKPEPIPDPPATAESPPPTDQLRLIETRTVPRVFQLAWLDKTAGRFATGHMDSEIPGRLNGEVRFWELQPNGLTEIQRFEPLRADVASIAVSTDGSLFAAGAGRRRWNTTEGLFLVKLLRVSETDLEDAAPPLEHAAFVLTLEFSPTEPLLAAGGYGGLTVLWDVSAAEPVKRAELSGPDGIVESMAFHPAGTVLATANSLGGNFARPGPVQLWNPVTGDKVGEFQAHDKGMVRSMRFTPDGQRLITSSIDGTLRIWRIDGSEATLVTTVDGDGRPIWSMDISPDGRRVAAGTDMGTVHVWDLGSSEFLYSSTQHERIIYSIRFTPDSQRLITGGDDGTLKLWQLPQAE